MFVILIDYVEVENGALSRDVTRSWKMILGGHGKDMGHGKFLWKKCGNRVSVTLQVCV